MTDPKTWKRAAGGGGPGGGGPRGRRHPRRHPDSANAADTGHDDVARELDQQAARSTPSPAAAVGRAAARPATRRPRSEKAVLAKYPGATIERTETDSDGVLRVAHRHRRRPARDRAGGQVSFAVTGTQTGGRRIGAGTTVARRSTPTQQRHVRATPGGGLTRPLRPSPFPVADRPGVALRLQTKS